MMALPPGFDLTGFFGDLYGVGGLLIPIAVAMTAYAILTRALKRF